MWAPDQQRSQMFFCTYQKYLLLISGSLLKTAHKITSCWPCQCYFWLYIFSLFPASPTSGTSPFPAAACMHSFHFFRTVASASFKTILPKYDQNPNLLSRQVTHTQTNTKLCSEFFLVALGCSLIFFASCTSIIAFTAAGSQRLNKNRN